jgi:hypothetical protein
MSNVVILYDSNDIFSDIGPTPFISRDVQNIFSSSEKNIIDTLSLTGRAKRGYSYVSGAVGPIGVATPTWVNCQSGFGGMKDIADILASKFSKNFKKLQLVESVAVQGAQGIQGIQGVIGFSAFEVIEEWEACIVRSISFEDDKWYDWVNYTIKIDCYKKGYYESYGIIEPKRSVDLDILPDNNINVKLSCSCKGINKNNSGFQNAKNFIADNSTLLESDLTNFYLSSLDSPNNNLLSKESDFADTIFWDPINSSISSNFISAPDGTLTADRLTALSSDNYIRTKGSNNLTLELNNTYEFSINVKSGDGEWVVLEMFRHIDEDISRMWFNTKTGEIGTAGSTESTEFEFKNKNSQYLGDGWYKISFIAKAINIQSHYFRLKQVNGDNTYNSNNTLYKTIYIWKASIKKYIDIYDIKNYKSFLISEEESLNRLTGEVSLNKNFILQSTLAESNYGILKYTRDISYSEKGEVTVKINGSHQGPLLAKGLAGVSERDSTLEAIKNDISNKDWYSIANEIYLNNLEQEPEDFSPLYTTPVNFSLQRNFSKNSIEFSLEYSNKQDNKIYIIDDTQISNDLVSSRKCIQCSITIKSEIKCKEERWKTIVDYYNNFDFINYVQTKWTQYGNTERLNFNEKDNSYSEDQFAGVIQISANFCNSLGNDCGCLQDLKYEYSFVPALKEVKASLPINSNGCHFIEDLNLLKRATFSIKGSLIKPICCSYEKTIAQLKNRMNQISNSIFYGDADTKLLDVSQITKSSPAGSINFDFSWSAKKGSIIPEDLL